MGRFAGTPAPDRSESSDHDEDHTEMLQSQSEAPLALFKPNPALGIVRHEGGRISKYIGKHKSVSVKFTAGTPRVSARHGSSA